MLWHNVALEKPLGGSQESLSVLWHDVALEKPLGGSQSSLARESGPMTQLHNVALYLSVRFLLLISLAPSLPRALFFMTTAHYLPPILILPSPPLPPPLPLYSNTRTHIMLLYVKSAFAPTCSPVEVEPTKPS